MRAEDYERMKQAVESHEAVAKRIEACERFLECFDRHAEVVSNLPTVGVEDMMHHNISADLYLTGTLGAEAAAALRSWVQAKLYRLKRELEDA